MCLDVHQLNEFMQFYISLEMVVLMMKGGICFSFLLDDSMKYTIFFISPSKEKAKLAC